VLLTIVRELLRGCNIFVEGGGNGSSAPSGGESRAAMCSRVGPGSSPGPEPVITAALFSLFRSATFSGAEVYWLYSESLQNDSKAAIAPCNAEWVDAIEGTSCQEHAPARPEIAEGKTTGPAKSRS
jgi:hypothetical protein